MYTYNQKLHEYLQQRTPNSYQMPCSKNAAFNLTCAMVIVCVINCCNQQLNVQYYLIEMVYVHFKIKYTAAVSALRDHTTLLSVRQ